MATVSQVKRLLEPTSVPADLVDSLLDEASALWLMSEPAALVASDVALCHPPLGPEEVRALVVPNGERHHVAVLAHDRAGLLAGTASALATHGVSVVSASATTWPARNLALQRVVAVAGPGAEPDWDQVGEHLRAVLGRGELRAPAFVPEPEDEVLVDAAPQGLGRVMVTVSAPDRVGLLWAIAAWFADQGCNIEVASVAADEHEPGRVHDVFVVEGEVDAAGLAAALAPPDRRPRRRLPFGLTRRPPGP